MKKFAGKKLLTILFISAILLSILPICSVGSVKVNANSSAYTCSNAKLQTLINQYSGSYWSGSYNGAYMCKGFADKMFNALYGTGSIGRYNSGYHYYIPSPNGAKEVGRDSDASRSEIVAIMKKGKSGDYIQWSRGYSQHSAIFVSCDDNGIYMFDCNYIAPDKCGVHYVTFDKLARTNYGVSLYTSTSNIKDKKPKVKKSVKFEITEKNIELEFDETKVLKVNGAKSIADWQTSDASVAVVNSDGYVHGTGKGTATITVMDIDGKTSTCVVTVNCSEYRHAIEGFLNCFDLNDMTMNALNEGVLLF